MQPQLAPAPHTPNKGYLAQQELSQEHALREQLMQHVNHPNDAAAQGNQHVSVGPHAQQVASPTTPAHNIDPAIAGPPIMSHSPGESGGDENGVTDSARKAGKRELSTSKRAAQNRAAQRAFRQRKEGHIKKLEEQVREAQALAEKFQDLERENYSLREYVLSLQSSLLELHGKIPPAPVNITAPRAPSGDLSGPSVGGAPASAGSEYSQAPTAQMVGAEALSHLQQHAAHAVADMGKDGQRGDIPTDPALKSGRA